MPAIPTLNFVIIGPGKPNGCRNSVVRDCDGVNVNESLVSTFVKDLPGKNEAFGLRGNSDEHLSHRSFPKVVPKYPDNFRGMTIVS